MSEKVEKKVTEEEEPCSSLLFSYYNVMYTLSPKGVFFNSSLFIWHSGNADRTACKGKTYTWTYPLAFSNIYVMLHLHCENTSMTHAVLEQETKHGGY